MEDNGIKSIRYPLEADEKLTKLALGLGRSKKLLFMQMIDYFDKSKKDPKDLNDEALKKELVNGVDRIIRFIRTQEKEFLLPITTDSSKLHQIAANSIKYLDSLNRYAGEDIKKTNDILKALASLDKAIGKTQLYHEEKIQLKARFKKILDYYIAQRETLGWSASAAKKDELQKHTRQSLENL